MISKAMVSETYSPIPDARRPDFSGRACLALALRSGPTRPDEASDYIIS